MKQQTIITSNETLTVMGNEAKRSIDRCTYRSPSLPGSNNDLDMAQTHPAIYRISFAKDVLIFLLIYNV